MKMFAVFIIAQVGDKFAATTRATDKISDDEGVTAGFPGGKVDPGETAVGAAIREAAEEGWDIEIVSDKPVWTQVVQGKPVAWFSGTNPKVRKTFKEMGRIKPITCDKDTLTGFGNEEAIEAFKNS